MSRHRLTFRGEAGFIPPGTGLCLACAQFVDLEHWVDEDCPGHVVPMTKEAQHEH